MKERSWSRFDQASLNSTILVLVPTEDKAKLDSYNLLAVVLEIIEDGTQYRLGTKSGILERYFHRNQFQVTLVNLMNRKDVPMDITLSVRSAAIKENTGKGKDNQKWYNFKLLCHLRKGFFSKLSLPGLQ